MGGLMVQWHGCPGNGTQHKLCSLFPRPSPLRPADAEVGRVWKEGEGGVLVTRADQRAEEAMHRTYTLREATAPIPTRGRDHGGH